MWLIDDDQIQVGARANRPRASDPTAPNPMPVDGTSNGTAATASLHRRRRQSMASSVRARRFAEPPRYTPSASGWLMSMNRCLRLSTAELKTHHLHQIPPRRRGLSVEPTGGGRTHPGAQDHPQSRYAGQLPPAGAISILALRHRRQGCRYIKESPHGQVTACGDLSYR